ELGHLDVLINNAEAVAVASEPPHGLTEAEWDLVQAVSAKSVFFCTKHAINCMRRAGGGSIINLFSTYRLIGAHDAPPRQASKDELRLMAEADARLYAADHIRVNSIHLDFIGALKAEALKGSEGVEEGRRPSDSAHSLGHIAEPDDVAWAAVYLASDEAKFVTGSELVVDGGHTALSAALSGANVPALLEIWHKAIRRPGVSRLKALRAHTSTA